MPKNPLEQHNVDFYGPITTESDANAKYVMVIICDVSSYVLLYPIGDKSTAPEVIGKVVGEIN